MRGNNGFMIKSAMYSRPFLKETKSFLTGDFNARVGKDRQMWDSLGRHEARQVQEKCSEQRQGLYQVFVDFTKAVDSVTERHLRRF